MSDTDKKRVVIGLSGGVDSSVAAYLLKENGYQVIGVTLRTWQADSGAYSRCCEISDARKTADQLGIPFYNINSLPEFEEHVTEPFMEAYLKGTTPNPCVDCNRYVKWEGLLRFADEINAEYVATGHYARVVKTKSGRYTVEQAKTANSSITWDYYLENIAHVTPEQFEALRKGYSEAAAAYYAATGAKQTAQLTYDEYAAAETKALAAYTAAEAEAKAAGAAYMYALTNANALSANPVVIYPNLNTLKYSQYGARATWTLGQVDMGLSYYNGFYKQPSFNAEKLNSFMTSYLANGTVAEEDKFLAYDKKQTFGLEMSSIIWHFNVRGEFAYNLTDDMDGSDPWVHNNSIAWLGGFDIDLPFWNANLNVQETGSFILNGDECDKNTMDVDYNKKGYSNNKLVANVTTSFLNDKVVPEVTVMYGIERGDLVVMPKLAFKPDQNLTLTASGMYIHCADEDSEFYSWRENSFVSVGAKYQF